MSTEPTLEWNKEEQKFIFTDDFNYGSHKTQKVIQEHYEKELETQIQTKEPDFSKEQLEEKSSDKEVLDSTYIGKEYANLFSEKELKKVQEKYSSVFGGLFSQDLSQQFLKNLEIKDTLRIDKTYQANFKSDDNGINIKITNSKVQKVIIKDIDLNSIKIEDTEIEKLIINNVDIKEKLSFKNNRTTLICMILNRINFEEDSKVLFENLKIENFIYRKSYQESKFFDMNDIEVLKQFRIFKVFLKNTQFNNLNIENTNTIKLSHISFEDTIFNNVKWGNISRIKASRDIFRQLKFVNDSQGNFIEANSFYSEEMRRYEKEKKSFSDEVIFKLNKYLSNFGQSWLKPLFWIVLLIFIQFAVWFCYQKGYGFESEWVSILNSFAKELPVKKFLSSGFEFLSIFFYIAYIVLIYHLTIALRRQTKR